MPGLLDGFSGAQPCYEFIGGRAEPKELVAERILQNVPAFPAEILTPDIDAGAKADLLARNPVPGLTKCWQWFSHNSPPEPHAEEINGAMREHPEQGPFFHLQFAETTHAGTPPFLDASIHLAA